MSSTPLLYFDQVSFGYLPDNRMVLHSLSLEIQPGTVTAILGPNGAGKTTLLHLALGWLLPQSGQIRLEGKALSQYSRRELGQKMALVPQNERIPFDYSVLEYVLLGRAPHLAALELPGKQDCLVSEDAIARAGLDHLSSRPITTLSGGEKQLALVARALAQQPSLLILDEPTSHLDLGNKARLIKLLQDLSARGVTLLLTTHEPDVAAAVATHLVLMRDGQVRQTGLLSQVFTSEYLSATYNLPVNVTQINGRRVALWTPQ